MEGGKSLPGHCGLVGAMGPVAEQWGWSAVWDTSHPPLSALYRGAQSLSVEPLVPRTPEVYCPGPSLTNPGSQGPASEVHLKLGVMALLLRGAPQGRQVRLGPVCHPFGVTPCARSVPKGPSPDSVLCCPPTSGRAVDVGELLTP